MGVGRKLSARHPRQPLVTHLVPHAALVARDKEPITPFIAKVRALCSQVSIYWNHSLASNVLYAVLNT